jgi:uncharacterized metal-binding protein YceD (DUF177 family)
LGKFDTYKVDLRNISLGVHPYEFLLENKFFMDIDGPEVQKGKVKVSLTVKHSAMMFEMNFLLEGVVYVPCDRCLDDMEIPIETKNRLVVKFGKEYAEESDEIVVIPEDEGAINLAWFLYEFIALAIPMKHIHPPGKCNKLMSTKLKKHSAKSISDEGDYAGDEADDIMVVDEDVAEAADPRWDTLKGFVENDNN